MSEVFFPALFPGFEPPEELAQALERLAVVHAELDRDARTIRLDAQAEKYLAEKQLQTLCRAVEKAYGLKSLELLVRYPEEELPHMDFRDLAQVFIRAFSPSAAVPRTEKSAFADKAFARFAENSSLGSAIKIRVGFAIIMFLRKF